MQVVFQGDAPPPFRGIKPDSARLLFVLVNPRAGAENIRLTLIVNEAEGAPCGEQVTQGSPRIVRPVVPVSGIPGTHKHAHSARTGVGVVGCTPETLRSWVKRFEVDTGRRDGLTAEGRARLKALEKENKELRRANEILKTASAFFAQAELDRKLKR